MSRQITTAAGAAALLTGSLGIAGAAHGDQIKVTNNADSGAGSLRSAIETANQDPARDLILFASRVSGEITLAEDLPVIEAPVEIRGPGPRELAIDGDGHQIFYADQTARISGLTLRDANRVAKPRPPIECPPYSMKCVDLYYAPLSGAIAIGAGDSVTVRDVHFTGNSGQTTGAISGIDIDSLKIVDSVFTGNHGAIAIERSTGEIEITGSTFRGNKTSFGSVIELSQSQLAIERSRFVGNEGGAVKLVTGNAVVKRSLFAGNENIGDGGALDIFAADADISGSVFRDNESVVGGGGAINIEGETTSSIRSSTIVGNRSGTKELTENVRQEGGGGVRFNGWKHWTALEIANVTITGNQAINGAGGGIESRGRLFLDSVTIAGNSVKQLDGGKEVRGGGLNMNESDATIRNSIISGNAAGGAHDLAAQPQVPGYPPDAPPRFDITYSLIGDPGSVSGASLTGHSNSFGKRPKLGALRNNGGPTPTMLPRPDSPALNSGSTELRVDQRGFPRPALAGDDIGAVERQGAAFTFGRARLLPRRGIAELTVKARGAGIARLIGTGAVRSRPGKALRSGSVKLRVKARGAAAARLARTGSVRVRAKVRFESVDGPTRTKSKVIRLAKR